MASLPAPRERARRPAGPAPHEAIKVTSIFAPGGTGAFVAEVRLSDGDVQRRIRAGQWGDGLAGITPTW